MNMIRMELDFSSLLRWAHAVRVPSADVGYLAHAALRTALGSLAPQPFYLEQRGGDVLLGYGDATEEELHDALQRLPDEGPDAWLRQALRSCACKALPAVWTTDAVLRFSVLACPVRRFHSKDPTGEKRGEKDAFLLDVERAKRMGEQAPSRAQSYLQWLEKEFARHNAVEALELRLMGHRLVRPQRRGGRLHAGAATTLGGRPEAHFEGLLCMRDSHAFHDLLLRGVGRHRAFGYGMLLVRPA